MRTKEQKTEKRVTIKDVAKAAGVSIATVSYVLNDTPGQAISDDTKKKVLQFANLLGYECNVTARFLATGKSGTIAAVIKETPAFAAQYYLKFLTELSRLLSRDGIDLKLVVYDDGIKRQSAFDAYITIGLCEEEFRAFADTKYVPVIAVDSVVNDFLFFRITDDYSRLAASAKAETKLGKVCLVTFELPPETLKTAERYFDSVIVVASPDDLDALDKDAFYVTVSDFIYDCASKRVPIKLYSASFALKASAAAEFACKAMNRAKCSDEEHDIRV